MWNGFKLCHSASPNQGEVQLTPSLVQKDVFQTLLCIWHIELFKRLHPAYQEQITKNCWIIRKNCMSLDTLLLWLRQILLCITKTFLFWFQLGTFVTCHTPLSFSLRFCQKKFLAPCCDILFVHWWRSFAVCGTLHSVRLLHLAILWSSTMANLK